MSVGPVVKVRDDGLDANARAHESLAAQLIWCIALVFMQPHSPKLLTRFFGGIALMVTVTAATCWHRTGPELLCGGATARAVLDAVRPPTP